MKELCQYGNLPDDEWDILPWIPDLRPPFKIWVKPEQIAPFFLIPHQPYAIALLLKISDRFRAEAFRRFGLIGNSEDWERLVRGVIREFEENNSGKDLFHFDSDEDVFCVYSQYIDDLMMLAKLIREKVGRSFGYEWTSMAYQEENASSSTSIIFILAIVVAFLILAAQYESWTDPFAVIMGLPIALLGVVIGVMVMNLPISVYTQIGVVLLIALAAKNAILIVEFARDYRAAGKSTEESAIEGGRVRLRPILMTSFAFILGTFPLVISTGAGASSRISLGIAVFAGMLMTSLVGTLFIPNFYLMMESLHERFTRKKKKDKDTEENLPAVYEEQLPMKRE